MVERVDRSAGSGGRARLRRRAHRVLLATTRGRLRRPWDLLYRLAADLAAAYLLHGEQGTAFARGDRSELLPAVSDIDLLLVVRADEGGGADRVRARYDRAARLLPSVRAVIDPPVVLEEGEVAAVLAATPYTIGLDGTEPVAAYLPGRAAFDAIRALERPGVYGSTTGLRRIRGPLQLTEAARSRDDHLVAGWLELVWLWRLAFRAARRPRQPHVAFLCVKLVADPARILLWLDHGERASGRVDALARAARLMPEEEAAFRTALELYRSLPSAPTAPLAETLPAFVRLSARIAQLLDRAAAERQEQVEVSLVGGDERPPSPLPLCDWRAIACPSPADETFDVARGSPESIEDLLGASRAQRNGSYVRLTAGPLAVLPADEYERSRLRAASCETTDPVSFAVAAGRRTATFPDLRGLSLRDTARRAVAEQRARLLLPQETDGVPALLVAARAALVAENLELGAPILPLTVAATAACLHERGGSAGEIALHALGGGPVSAETLAALRAAVVALPAYRGTLS